VLALPVTRHGALVGVLSLTHTLGHVDRMDALTELCQVTAVMDPFIVRREDFQTFTTRTQDLLIRAVEFVTPEGDGHVLRVAHVASELAALLDLSARTRQLLWQASLYHDVGKLVLAGADASEVHRFHAGAGADFLRATVALQPVAALVETHQERWDGSGVPHGLKGDAVPIEGWVLALAEDLDEFRHRHRQLAFADWIERFYDGPAASHHPEAVEALSTLVDAGKLALS
jgi:response regulator RpfG family c-di-GMP phosphodiesterase